VSQDAWPTPTGGGPSREPLPRVEDLPVAEQGYEQESVRAAFDSFYRHAAQLDAALRTLEAVDSFHRQAAALRADLRSLRTAGWTQQPWSAAPAYGAGFRAPREGISPAVWRIAGEVVFLIAASVVLGVAKQPWWVIVLVMAVAFLVVVVIEWAASRDRWVTARGVAAVAHPVVEAEPAGEQTEEDEAVGWAAFEEAQEPSDAMTMIGAPAEAPGVEEQEPVVEAASEEAAPGVAAVEEAEPEAVPEPEFEAEAEAQRESPRRRWWRRSSDEPEPATTGASAEPPHHVRILPANEATDEPLAADPWERGFQDEDEPEEETGENETPFVTEAEQPSRRRFRRR
jgi:hypothetical protein